MPHDPAKLRPDDRKSGAAHHGPHRTAIGEYHDRHLFALLAADGGATAIGVILSGTASDGTLGLTAVKREGGITFAQDSQSAKYDGMPANAVAAGCVDLILTPEGIAQELARIRQHPFVAGSYLESPEEGETASDAYLSQIFRLLRRPT